MALSAAAIRRLQVACTNDAVGLEIAAAIESLGTPAAKVTQTGVVSNLTALAPAAVTMTGAACAGGATPSATNVNTAINAATAEIKTMLDAKTDNVDAETLRTEVEARLDVLETKVNAILSNMTTAGLMVA